jgi:hypothetical protein
LLLFLLYATGQQYSLIPLATPNICYGGQVCSVQPLLQIVNSAGTIALTFSGIAYVQMASSPSGYEPLYLADPSTQACTVDGNCGQKVVGTLARVRFINGVASFQVQIFFHLFFRAFIFCSIFRIY